MFKSKVDRKQECSTLPLTGLWWLSYSVPETYEDKTPKMCNPVDKVQQGGL